MLSGTPHQAKGSKRLPGSHPTPSTGPPDSTAIAVIKPITTNTMRRVVAARGSAFASWLGCSSFARFEAGGAATGVFPFPLPGLLVAP